MIKKRRPGRPVELAALPKEYDKGKYCEPALRKLSELGWFYNFWVRYSLKSNENLPLSEKRERILEILEQPLLTPWIPGFYNEGGDIPNAA